MTTAAGVPLAVFDVDGTLVDSRALLQAGTAAAFEAAGLSPPSYDESRKVVGLSFVEGLRELAPGLDDAGVARLKEAARDVFETLYRDPAHHEPLYNGAAALLDTLRRSGWRVAMATGKSRRGVERIVAMHGWETLFESTHCADDGPGKPHPAMLQAAMAALGAAPSETVMIGDTSFDMSMARAAGARAQGVAWGFHTTDEVLAGGADNVANTMEELGGELRAFGDAVRRGRMTDRLPPTG